MHINSYWFWKLPKKIIIVFLIFLLLSIIYFAAYFGIIPFTRGLREQVAKYNTLYVENFSWDKMGHVREGMTPQEVVEIMGQPYDGMPEKPFCPSWSYGNPDPWKRFPPFADDFYWITAQVCFDQETNTVSYIGVQNIFFN